MGSTLYTERNSSIVDMRWICLIFFFAALVNFCSMAPLNERDRPLTHGLRSKRAASAVTQPPDIWDLRPRPRPYPVRRSARNALSDDDFRSKRAAYDDEYVYNILPCPKCGLSYV